MLASRERSRQRYGDVTTRVPQAPGVDGVPSFISHTDLPGGRTMVPERSQARANPARGLALIATAVIVGLFLLRNWDGSSAGGTELVTADAGGDAAAGN